VFNPRLKWKIQADSWCSQGHNTPFWHEEMPAKVTHTLQAGQIIYSNK